MRSATKSARTLFVLSLAWAGCGGKSNSVQMPLCSAPQMASPADPNVVPLIVDRGPLEANPPYYNGVFAAVTVCVPGTTVCQTVDHVLVDTGSVGLRLLESVVTLPLPAATDDKGVALAECLSFMDGGAWGPLYHADVQIGGESVSNIPIQLIGDSVYPIAAGCRSNPIVGLNADDSKGSVGLSSNGVLGVGPLSEDCGDTCAASLRQSMYYACPSTCTSTLVPVAEQLPNPVARFPADNNGVIIQLPCLPEMGAASVSGTLVFGIGTQSNNDLGSATILPETMTSGIAMVDTEFPEAGALYTGFMDSGSNEMFFLDSQTSKIGLCGTTGTAATAYCPSSTTILSAIVVTGDQIAPVEFVVANSYSLLRSKNFAFCDLAAPMPGWPVALAAFDWGLPFFFGRSVYTAIDGKATPVGPGPFVAF